jgi:hypothetical protein
VSASAVQGNVLPDPLPPTVYIRTDLPALVAQLIARATHRSAAGVHVGHRLHGCPEMPAAGAGRPVRGGARLLATRWCHDCFPGGRCREWVLDTLGRRARCGQPSGPGVECRWHLDLAIDEDKRTERAA